MLLLLLLDRFLAVALAVIGIIPKQRDGFIFLLEKTHISSILGFPALTEGVVLNWICASIITQERGFIGKLTIILYYLQLVLDGFLNESFAIASIMMSH